MSTFSALIQCPLRSKAYFLNALNVIVEQLYRVSGCMCFTRLLHMCVWRDVSISALVWRCQSTDCFPARAYIFAPVAMCYFCLFFFLWALGKKNNVSPLQENRTAVVEIWEWYEKMLILENDICSLFRGSGWEGGESMATNRHPLSQAELIIVIRKEWILKSALVPPRASKSHRR